jgi:hypothetical protein
MPFAQAPVTHALSQALDVLGTALGARHPRGPARLMRQAPDAQVHPGRVAARPLQVLVQDPGPQRAALIAGHARAKGQVNLLSHIKKP